MARTGGRGPRLCGVAIRPPLTPVGSGAVAARRLVVPLVALAMLAACQGSGSPAKPGASPATPATTTPAPATAPLAATTVPPATAAAALVWQARASAPAVRQEVASAVLAGRIWVIGGLNAAGAATTRVESYDPATDRWAAGPDLPLALHHLAAATYKGEVVVAGGFQAASDLYSRPSDRVLALRGGSWVDLPRLRRPRGAAAAEVVGDTLYVVGGRDSGLLVEPTEAFDGTAWQDRAPIPTPRDHLAAVSDGKALYAVGGRFLSPAATADAFERYDPARDSWTALPPLPTARGGMGAALANGRVIVAGGEDASHTYPQVEAFDVRAGTWSALANQPTPRHGLAVAAVGNAVYALVGGTEAGVAPSAVAEALVPGA